MLHSQARVSLQLPWYSQACFAMWSRCSAHSLQVQRRLLSFALRTSASGIGGTFVLFFMIDLII